MEAACSLSGSGCHDYCRGPRPSSLLLLLGQISYCDRIRPALVLWTRCFNSEAFPIRRTRLLRCYVDARRLDRTSLSQLCGEGSKSFVKVYYFVHRNILPVCIFSFWTRDSFNFGELNLYSAPQLKKATSLRERMLKEILIYFSFDFFFSSQGFFFLFTCSKKGYVFLHCPVFVNVIFQCCIVFDSYIGQN